MPSKNPKNQDYEKMKKVPNHEILKTKKQKQQQQQQKRLEWSSSFYTSAPKNHNCYFLLWAFLFVYPEKSKLKKIEKKKKKNLGISSFYTSEPKSWSYATLFLRYGVGQIVIIFHFRLFFALLPQHQKSKF